MVGAVQDGRVGVAAARGVAAADVPFGEGAGQGEPDLAELGGDAGGPGFMARRGRHVLIVACRVRDPDHIFQYKYCMRARGPTGYVAAWQPSSGTADAACFARAVVAAAGPHSRERAKNLLWAAGRLADWGIGLGLEPVPEVLLHPSVIERFAAHAPACPG